MDTKDIAEFIKSHQAYLKTAEDLYRIYNQEMMPFLAEALNASLSPSGAREALSRACPVNLFPKVVNKVSGVYDEQPQRDDTELAAFLDLDNVMSLANRYLNIHRIVAVEPVWADGNKVSFLRVLPANKFLVMDDGTTDANIVAFIKVLTPKTFMVYTKEQYITMDLEGSVTQVEPNLHGIIPVTIIKRDVTTAMPTEDLDTKSMCMLMPLLLSDLNYAMKFQCFSIIYSVDVDTSEMVIAPNAVWPLRSVDTGVDEKKNPMVGTITPTVDAEKLLNVLFTQYRLWLESRSIKVATLSGGDSLSGIAKAIDQADTVKDIKYQRGLFTKAEADLSEIITQVGGYQVSLKPVFPKQVILQETPKEVVERVVLEMDNGLTTREQGIRTVHPDYTEDEVQATMVSEVNDLSNKIESKEPQDVEDSNGV